MIMNFSEVKYYWKSKWVKVTHWEYWPFGVVYLPVMIYWLWLSIKARSLFFFSLSNPGIEFGGMLGESKFSILKNIPTDVCAKTVLVPKNANESTIADLIKKNQLNFPLICKPDIGERGNGVEKVFTIEQLIKKLENFPDKYILQEFISYPLELGIFWYKDPKTNKGKVSSIVRKGFLTIVGNGKDSVETLMKQDPRAFFQWKRFKSIVDSNKILKEGERLELEPIGNHCRGTTFYDDCHEIDSQLERVISEISESVPGFYYGRYDLRTTSYEDLRHRKNIKVMELNGCGAEPAHIYQPGYSLFRGWKVLFQHWKTMYEISLKNKNELNSLYLPYAKAKVYYQRNKKLR